MTGATTIGWKLEAAGPVALVLAHNRRLPEAQIIDVDPGTEPCSYCERVEPCDCGPDEDCACSCGRCYPKQVVRYPEDPILFFAVLGVWRGHIGRDC